MKTTIIYRKENRTNPVEIINMTTPISELTYSADPYKGLATIDELFDGKISEKDFMDALPEFRADFSDKEKIAYRFYAEKAINSVVAKKLYIPKLQKIAQEKNYKPGWIFYQIKDIFGYSIAETVCEK